MANNFTKFRNGLNTGGTTTTSVTVLGDVAYRSDTNVVELHNGTSASAIITAAHTATLTNKTITGNTAVNLVSGAGTISFNTSGTITVPNATDTLVGKATTDVLTNKTLSGNTATNLINGAGTINFNSTGTITVPNATDTLVGRNTTDTLTNKTLDNTTSLTIKDGSFTIENTADTSKLVVFSLTGLSTATTRTLTVPDASLTIVGTTTTQTLTNKTLSGNTSTNFVNGSGTFNINSTGTITVPNATDTLVGKATTDTLTNKTLTGNTAVNLVSGSGTFTLNTTGTITAPNATDTLVGKATTDSLTNKTFADAITGAEISTPSTPSSGFDKLYFKSDHNLYSLTSGGVETQISGGSGSTPNSEVFVRTGNGHGSTNTDIRRYTNIIKNVGTDITYADSATNGASFTINTAGEYSCAIIDSNNTNATVIGITVNSTSLTTSVTNSANYDFRIAVQTGSANQTLTATSPTLHLSVNDVVRPHTDGNSQLENGNDIASFRITRVS